MIDLVTLNLRAGNGGLGRVSFRREKFVPKGGPDGGKGGDGGNIIVIGSSQVKTLRHLAGVKTIAAAHGQAGGKRKMFGAKGENTIIEVPVGTTLWLEGENLVSHNRRLRYGVDEPLRKSDIGFQKFYLEKEGQAIPEREPDDIQSLADEDRQHLVDITEEGQTVVICQGGFGGRGNESFKSSELTTPLMAEYGTYGEQKQVVFELKLLADVGLVGLPNAGKSTLLSKVTKAQPKIANYPFTTLEPNLGVVDASALSSSQQSRAGDEAPRSLVMADIPGLIEGASQGKGLGYDFLRHIEHCQVLVFVLTLEENVIFDESLSTEAKAEQIYQQYADLQHELKEYTEELLEKPFLVTLSKGDIYNEELQLAIKKLFQTHSLEIQVFSSATGAGLSDVLVSLFKHFDPQS